MAEEPEYYRAQPMPPRGGARPGSPYGSTAGASWGGPTVNVNVVGGKSTLLAYVLWFFLGQFGIHKFYLAQPFQGLIYLTLGVAGWATVGIIIGWFLLIPLWLLLLVDIFVIPVRVGTLNARLARRVSGY